MGLPETYGCAVKEFITGANPSLGIVMLMTNGVSELMNRFGTAEQKSEYCPKLNSGEVPGTMCITEAQAGSGGGFAANVSSRWVSFERRMLSAAALLHLSVSVKLQRLIVSD